MNRDRLAAAMNEGQALARELWTVNRLRHSRLSGQAKLAVEQALQEEREYQRKFLLLLQHSSTLAELLNVPDRLPNGDRS